MMKNTTTLGHCSFVYFYYLKSNSKKTKNKKNTKIYQNQNLLHHRFSTPVLCRRHTSNYPLLRSLIMLRSVIGKCCIIVDPINA